jgi:hypothetical protein
VVQADVRLDSRPSEMSVEERRCRFQSAVPAENLIGAGLAVVMG